jgi:hypothetical protein
MIPEPVLDSMVTAAAFVQLADPVLESALSARFEPIGMAGASFMPRRTNNSRFCGVSSAHTIDCKSQQGSSVVWIQCVVETKELFSNKCLFHIEQEYELQES